MRAVIPNLFRNRQIEVDKPKSCRRKRDFQAHAPLNQVQGDEMVALSFRTCFGIARLKRISSNLAVGSVIFKPMRP